MNQSYLDRLTAQQFVHTRTRFMAVQHGYMAVQQDYMAVQQGYILAQQASMEVQFQLVVAVQALDQ